MTKVIYHQIWPTIKGMALSLVHVPMADGYTTIHYRPATEKHILNCEEEQRLQNDLYQLWRS